MRPIASSRLAPAFPGRRPSPGWQSVSGQRALTICLAQLRLNENLATLWDATKPKSVYWSSQIEVQRREVAAWITQASGKPEEAIAGMRSATELEESMDKDAVTPGAVVPARELLAQMLQLQNRPQESLKVYETILMTAPNRFNALWGAGSMAESAGDNRTALKYFSKLVEVGVGAERPELQTARTKAKVIARK